MECSFGHDLLSRIQLLKLCDKCYNYNVILFIKFQPCICRLKMFFVSNSVHFVLSLSLTSPSSFSKTDFYWIDAKRLQALFLSLNTLYCMNSGINSTKYFYSLRSSSNVDCCMRHHCYYDDIQILSKKHTAKETGVLDKMRSQRSVIFVYFPSETHLLRIY